MTELNVLSEKCSKRLEWKVEKSFGFEVVSGTFSFQDRNCCLEFYFGTWNDSEKQYHNSSLFFKSCKQLLSPVEVVVHVSLNSEILPTQKRYITSVRQCIWTYAVASSLRDLFIFDVIIYADPSKNPMIRPICTADLTEDFGKLLEEGENSDVVLKCGEKVFHVHRNILSVRSDVFAAMFRNEMAEKKSGTVNIKDVDPDILHCFLRYIYSGKIEEAVTLDTAVDLYKVADRYAMPSLKRKCASIIENQLTEDSICSVLLMSDQYRDQELMEAAAVFAANRNEFLKSDQWDVFSKDHQQLGFEVYKKFAKKLLFSSTKHY